MIVSFWGPAYFQVLWLFISFRECIQIIQNIIWIDITWRLDFTKNIMSDKVHSANNATLEIKWPLFSLEQGLVLRGWPPKIEVIGVLGTKKNLLSLVVSDLDIFVTQIRNLLSWTSRIVKHLKPPQSVIGSCPNPPTVYNSIDQNS